MQIGGTKEIFQVYDALSKIPNGFFTVAAAFGNVHGVYQPGNVKLEPTILDKAQLLAIFLEGSSSSWS